MKIIQMIIEKHFNRMLRMFKASNDAPYFIRHRRCPQVNIFLYNKMNTDIKQGS